ncbi:hypothetical protein KZZ52_10825 [Dactylosporangium sp. AC04546]|uniref:SCO7613 C-terminal domain-containing membrane protein n=1 Tax=Dactylosporangium sp. AC04546 TaxID=2862460 RepID=UPI002E7B1378|nr:hypothetical protein [Dactylosporangium sp. AC04546]WVK85850.1 hypothetical protein KZZ52_10825 [Dactylosporangium sp. AC04546]
MVTYPCPFCGAPADLEAGCSGCGRPAYPDAAEVLRLNARTIELHGEVEATRAELDEARSRYRAAVQRFSAAQSQRNLLATRVRQAVATARQQELPAGQPEPPTPQPQPAIAALAQPVRPVAVPPWQQAPKPEAETQTVQNLLFILGGLLLGSAAVVFAAVAWANFGVIGRAAILAVVTLVTLAVPVVALRRGLRGTAETFAALGLLLVVLDGYAAWYVNLAGLADATRPSTFAGLVGLVTAAIGGGYAVATKLHAPRIAAVVALQPVLPLLASGRGFGPAGWAGVFVLLAAANALLARTVGILAWVLAGCATLIVLPPLLYALASADGVPAAARTAVSALLLAALVVATGLLNPITAHVATGVAAGLVAAAGMRLVAEAAPGQRYIGFALVAALIAGVANALPTKVRRGGWIGALVVAGVTALPYAGAAVAGAARAIEAALPAWRSHAGALDAVYDWQIPAAIVVLGAAVAWLVRHRAAGYATVVTAALAAPAAWDTPLTAVLIVDAALLVALAAVALRLDRAAAVALPFVALHLLLTGLVTAPLTLASALVVAAVSAVVAARGEDRPLRLPAAVAACALLPVAAAAACRSIGGTARAADVPLPLMAAFAGLLLATAAAVLLRRHLATGAGALAVSVTVAGLTIAAVVVSATDGGRTPFGVLAAAALLCLWPVTTAGKGLTPGEAESGQVPAAAAPGTGAGLAGAGWTPGAAASRRAGPGLAEDGWVPGAVVAGLVSLVAVVPAVLVVVFRPYQWLTAVWRGAPDGVGLGTGSGDALGSLAPALRAGPAAAGLVLLAASALLAARRFRLPVRSATVLPLTFAAVLACVAFEVPWPGVPAVTLAGGLITGVLAAVRPLRVNAGAVTCWLTAGAGLAGCLATEAATLAALGAIVAAAAVTGVAGAHAGARVAGWLTAAVAAGWLAFAAGQAADLPLRWTAYCVLAAAALLLAVARVVARLRPTTAAPSVPTPAAVPAARRGLEGLVVEAVAHAAALVAVLLAVGHLEAMAGIAGLWGVALGLRALSGAPRGWFAGAAAGAELIAYWLVLAANGVDVTEAYTVPAGALAVAAGWVVSSRNASVTSWVAFAPGLLAGFAPSLALVFAGGEEPLRRLVIGAVALGVVVGGAVWRLQAPFVVGGSVLGLLAVHEIALYWDLLPRWAPLAVAGLVLVTLATTYERRRRDLNRLKAAVGRMR